MAKRQYSPLFSWSLTVLASLTALTAIEAFHLHESERCFISSGTNLIDLQLDVLMSLQNALSGRFEDKCRLRSDGPPRICLPGLGPRFVLSWGLGTSPEGLRTRMITLFVDQSLFY